MNLQEIKERLLNESGEVAKIPDPDTVKWLIDRIEKYEKVLKDFDKLELYKMPIEMTPAWLMVRKVAEMSKEALR